MTDHTPGPWIVENGTVYKRSGVRVTVPIARMDREAGNGTRPVERDCNARLIASAPELLKALIEIYKWAERAEDERQQSGPILRDYLRQSGETARAAITAAREEWSA